jgi:hypothetical protein
MTDQKNLNTLKTLAKRYARASRVPHHEALDFVAANLGFPHWKAIASATKDDWRPNPEQLAYIEAIVSSTNPSYKRPPTPYESTTSPVGENELVEEGTIGTHQYWLEEALDDVHLYGKGWHILVAEAPSAEPVVEVTDKRFKSNPIHDPEFVKEAIKIARVKAERVRARISSDWPRRSTKPDASGRTRHPLSGNLSAEWFCLHCDRKSTGAEIAGNMWHCPTCSATPIDMFSTPFWLEGDSE